MSDRGNELVGIAGSLLSSQGKSGLKNNVSIVSVVSKPLIFFNYFWSFRSVTEGKHSR
jgi:hypothetical protein